MTARTKPDAAQTRAIDQRTMASISPLPSPEEVFIDWLMSVPHGDSLEAAARYQIEMIDRRMSLIPMSNACARFCSPSPASADLSACRCSPSVGRLGGRSMGGAPAASSGCSMATGIRGAFI